MDCLDIGEIAGRTKPFCVMINTFILVFLQSPDTEYMHGQVGSVKKPISESDTKPEVR